MRNKIALVLCALVIAGVVWIYNERVAQLTRSYGGVPMPDLRVTNEERNRVRQQEAAAAAADAEVARLRVLEFDLRAAASEALFWYALTNPQSPHKVAAPDLAPKPVNIPIKVYQTIRSNAARDYPNDYQMQSAKIRWQVAAWRELNP